MISKIPEVDIKNIFNVIDNILLVKHLIIKIFFMHSIFNRSKSA